MFIANPIFERHFLGHNLLLGTKAPFLFEYA
ncbi:hypothetical protein L799_19345 [Enterobacter roggenkampii EC_38VIM1]|nr:hypothetical protein L799_19345 [Enterobacter roggenkampii EC_38VIM1]